MESEDFEYGQILSGFVGKSDEVTIGDLLSRGVLMNDTNEAKSNDQKIIYTGPSPRGWHRLQQAAECLQKYAWAYEAPRVEEGTASKSAALAKGSLVHLALAQHYARMRAAQKDPVVQLGALESDSPDAWVEPEEAVELIARLEKVENHVPGVLTTFRAYLDHYDTDSELQSMKIIAVEELLQTHIAGKHLFTGRMDLVYEDLGGRIWIVDHKTTGRLTSSHAQYYAISGQLLGYAHLAREKYGERFAGVKINLIQHDPPKFERLTLSRSPNLESRFEQIVVDIEESIERMKATGRDYDNWPKVINELSCFSRYGACSYIDQCRMGKGAKKAGNWMWKNG
jgi:hypothetical protein